MLVRGACGGACGCVMMRKEGGGDDSDEQLAVGVGEAGVKWGRGLDRGKECGEGKMGLPGVEET